MDVRNNSSRGKQTITWLSINLIWTIIVTVSNFVVPIFFSYEALSDWSIFNSIVALILTIVTAVIFIRWFRRAYYNLNQRGGTTTFSDGWASGAWFVPVLNFFRPFQIMNELWSRSIVMIGSTDDIKIETAKDSIKLINPWWFCWIGSFGVSIFSHMIITYTIPPSWVYEIYGYVDWATVIAQFMAGILLIQIVKRFMILESFLWARTSDPFGGFGEKLTDENWE